MSNLELTFMGFLSAITGALTGAMLGLLFVIITGIGR